MSVFTESGLRVVTGIKTRINDSRLLEERDRLVVRQLARKFTRAEVGRIFRITERMVRKIEARVPALVKASVVAEVKRDRKTLLEVLSAVGEN